MFEVYAGLSHLLVMRRELTYRYSPSSFCSRTVSFPIGRRTLERIGGGLKINHSNTCSRSSNSSCSSSKKTISKALSGLTGSESNQTPPDSPAWWPVPERRRRHIISTFVRSQSSVFLAKHGYTYRLQLELVRLRMYMQIIHQHFINHVFMYNQILHNIIFFIKQLYSENNLIHLLELLCCLLTWRSRVWRPAGAERTGRHDNIVWI